MPPRDAPARRPRQRGRRATVFRGTRRACTLALGTASPPGERALSDRPTVLTTAIATYRHTEKLKSGAVASDRLRLSFVDVPTISRAFAPMVRELRFDVSEMAIATFLQ